MHDFTVRAVDAVDAYVQLAELVGNSVRANKDWGQLLGLVRLGPVIGEQDEVPNLITCSRERFPIVLVRLVRLGLARLHTHVGSDDLSDPVGQVNVLFPLLVVELTLGASGPIVDGVFLVAVDDLKRRVASRLVDAGVARVRDAWDPKVPVLLVLENVRPEHGFERLVFALNKSIAHCVVRR